MEGADSFLPFFAWEVDNSLGNSWPQTKGVDSCEKDSIDFCSSAGLWFNADLAFAGVNFTLLDLNAAK
jgi:hypothetical protein